jgi:Protein of unknown function (DUF2937)
VPVPQILKLASARLERLFDRVLCVVGAVVFSQAPEFMQQYLQRLEGHLDEARLTLGRFRDAAAQSGMTLDQLVASAGLNPDPSMRTIGGVVQGASARVDHLAAADSALRGASAWSKPFVFLGHADWGIVKATWAIYRPAVPTTPEGFAYAGIGMIFALAFYYLAVKAPVAACFRHKAAKPAVVT